MKNRFKLAAIGAAAFALAPAGAHATQHDVRARIVFESDRAGSGDLYSMRQKDGMSTASPRTRRQTRVSQSGHPIAAASPSNASRSSPRTSSAATSGP